ncbi:uncharacterized protein LOC127735686 [Mytilus californianus]|uniref:uncharacterized protein LOC127735686 n=1 Tax=Mytilus californianus TaxID=6549 RepID=UPI00224685C8|nr:uncharacterized protein LOC127735686 [Mytilus californianus]
MKFYIVFCVCFILATAYEDDYFKFEKSEKFGGICDKRTIYNGWAYKPTPGTCDQFYQCDEEGVPHQQSCAAGAFYDGNECRHAEKVHCPYDPCQRKPHGYSYADGQSCYGYYVCINGRSKYLTCPNGFYYNAHKKSCHSDPTCFKDNLKHPCSFGTTYPCPGKPDQFYLYDGRSTLTTMRCPRGLWYRPDLCTCDWIIPGKIQKHGCSPMFHFTYNGNFLEKYNRVQQVPNNNVAIYRKSALFNKGGKIIIWAMNNIDLDNEFSLCFEFMAKTYKGEVALMSNDQNGYGATYKISYIPALGVVKAYILQKNKRLIQMQVFGVNPSRAHFVRFARSDDKLTLRVNNMAPASVECDDGIAKNGNPMVIGQAGGCTDFQGFIDEVKFYNCVPKGFLDVYDDLDSDNRHHHERDSDVEDFH